LKQFFYIVCLLLMTSCTWVKDDVDDCPYGFWLNLHYTYNILDVEAVEEYIDEVSVYVYDADGSYVSRIDVPRTTLMANNHRVRIEGLPHGEYQFVVWSGTTSNMFSISGAQSDKDIFRLALTNRDVVTTQLPSLYHGYLPTVVYNGAHAVHDVFMMKDTNQLACLVVSTSDEVVLEPDDFEMQVLSANGVMDADNSIATDQVTTYLPYIQEPAVVDDSEYGTLHGLKFAISTLRLMEDTDCRVALRKVDESTDIFNVSLPQYIGMIGNLYTQLGDRPLSVQEYLDRQDFYTIVFFLSADIDQLVQLKVNNWRIRAHNHIKL